jgi:hypothetical protein
VSDCCTPNGCTTPAPPAGLPFPGQVDRRNRAERRRDARATKR